MEFISVTFFLTTGAIALLARIRRVNFQRNVGLNKIYPLDSELNELVFTIEDKGTVLVRTNCNKKLYKILKTGSKWHLEGVSNNRILATINNSFRDRYIVLTNSYVNKSSPLNTSPSIIKHDSDWYQKLKKYYGTANAANFTFGTSIVLRWVGLEHFEVVTQENDKLLVDESIQVHQRVAHVMPMRDDLNSYSILFDFNKINIEVLVSTFLLSLLLQNSKLSGYLNHQEVGDQVKV